MKMVTLSYQNSFWKFFNLKGLSEINSTRLDKKSCSERKCFYSATFLHAVWKSDQVIKLSTQISTANYGLQLLPGCDCCVVDGNLVEDKYTWIKENTTYGKYLRKYYAVLWSLFNVECCRGDIVIKVGNIQVETTKHSTTPSPSTPTTTTRDPTSSSGKNQVIHGKWCWASD